MNITSLWGGKTKITAKGLQQDEFYNDVGNPKWWDINLSIALNGKTTRTQETTFNKYQLNFPNNFISVSGSVGLSELGKSVSGLATSGVNYLHIQFGAIRLRSTDTIGQESNGVYGLNGLNSYLNDASALAFNNSTSTTGAITLGSSATAYIRYSAGVVIDVLRNGDSLNIAKRFFLCLGKGTAGFDMNTEVSAEETFTEAVLDDYVRT